MKGKKEKKRWKRTKERKSDKGRGTYPEGFCMKNFLWYNSKDHTEAEV